MLTGKRAKKRRKKKPSPVSRPHSGCYPFELKLRAVKLYLEEGYSSVMIAEELGISNATVFEWAKRYRKDGEQGLRPRYPGTRRTAKVSSAAKSKAIELKKENPEYGSRRIPGRARRLQ